MIKIVDDFFEEVLFKKIKNYIVSQLFYEPRYLHNTTEKNSKTYYGARFTLNKDPDLLNTFIKQAETDYQDFMMIADSEVEITEEYLIFKFKLDN